MSDERDGADATGDGDDATTTGGRTAVASPLRPSGKRSRALTVDEDTDDESPKTDADDTKDGGKGKTKTAKKSGPGKGDRVNPIAYLLNYIKQVIAEMRKVIWPNRKQMVSYTSVVLVFLVFMVALIFVVDVGFAALVRGVFAGQWQFKFK